MGFRILSPVESPQGVVLSNLYCTIHAKFSLDRNGNPSGVLPDPTKAYVLRTILHYYVDTKKPVLFSSPYTGFLTEDELNLASGNFYEAIYYKVTYDLGYTSTEKY